MLVLLLLLSNVFARTGEQQCEGRGFKKYNCLVQGCCHWDDGKCWSAVGKRECNVVTNCDDADRLIKKHDPSLNICAVRNPVPGSKNQCKGPSVDPNKNALHTILRSDETLWGDIKDTVGNRNKFWTGCFKSGGPPCSADSGCHQQACCKRTCNSLAVQASSRLTTCAEFGKVNRTPIKSQGKFVIDMNVYYSTPPGWAFTPEWIVGDCCKDAVEESVSASLTENVWFPVALVLTALNIGLLLYWRNKNKQQTVEMSLLDEESTI